MTAFLLVTTLLSFALVEGGNDAARQTKKMMMLQRANLSNHNPNTDFRTMAEVYKYADDFAGAHTFDDLKVLLESPEVKRFNHNSSKPKTSKFALYKTHKTGSSTFSSVFFRFSARNHIRIQQEKLWRNEPIHSYGAVFQHLSSRGDEETISMKETFEIYNHLIENPLTFTIVRQPVYQTLSWICFYEIPETISEIEKSIFTYKYNIQSCDLAQYDETRLQYFLENVISKFTLVCISELFDECMVMLRRRMNWDLLDVTYNDLLDSASYRIRFDGFPFMKTPKFSELSFKARKTLLEKTSLDEILYTFALERWKKLVADEGESFQHELAVFRRVQDTLKSRCHQAPTHPACRWYGLTDMQFFRMIDDAGYAPPVDFDVK